MEKYIKLVENGIVLVVTVFSLGVIGLAGCGNSSDAPPSPAASPASGQVAAPAPQAVPPGAAKVFDKATMKEACSILTAPMVASMFAVPVGELKQMKIMGCMYTWESDTEELQVALQTMRVHKDLEMAKTWFRNATTSLTPEQAAAQMQQIKDRAKEKGDLNTKTKEKTANLLGDAIVGTGFTFADVPGLGDEARVNTDNGRLTVRIGNMQFSVSAYKGPKQPRFVPTGKSPKEMMKAAMKHTKDWEKSTTPARTQAASAVAKAVLTALPL